MKISKKDVTSKLPINIVIAENSEDYRPLPAHYGDGVVAFSFELSDEEIESIKKNKRIMVNLMTFNQPMQPINASVDEDEFNEMFKWAEEKVAELIGKNEDKPLEDD